MSWRAVGLDGKTKAPRKDNLGSLAVVEKHLALGATRKFSDRAMASISYVHAFKNSITSSTAPFNTIELKQNLLNFQVSYKF